MIREAVQTWTTYTPLASETKNALLSASRVIAAAETVSLDQIAAVLDQKLASEVDTTGRTPLIGVLAATCNGCGCRVCGCDLAV